MNPNQDQPRPQDAVDEELVAYLDHELPPDICARIESRLADDPAYRARLNRLQASWDMLDVLQPVAADESFTRGTLELVALNARRETPEKNRWTGNPRLLWGVCGAAALAALLLGFSLVRERQTRPDRQLVQDLPIIERVDEYCNVDSVEFIKHLEKEGLFTAEFEDGP